MINNYLNVIIFDLYASFNYLLTLINSKMSLCIVVSFKKKSIALYHTLRLKSWYIAY